MIIRHLIGFLLMLVVTVSYGQRDSIFHFVSKHSPGVTDFSVDNLGNLYLVYHNGQLKKLRPNGDSLAVFNNVRRFGKLHSVDVSNPLKVLLYYKNFSTIVILDRFLNERSVLDLRKQGLVQVKAIGQSYDNNIWVFDELDAKLKKIGDDGKLLDESNDFRLIFDSTPTPQNVIDQDKHVYVYDPLKGIYSFDYYGGFKSRVPFTGWSDFNVMNNSLFGRDAENLYRYDIGTMDLRELRLPPFMHAAEKIVIAPGHVYVMRDGAIVVYSYQ